MKAGADGSSRRTAVRGIACRSGKAELALPFETVGQIIEYTVFALPLARPFIAGLGLHQDWPLVSVTLSRTSELPRSGTSRAAKGILLETGGTKVPWALEVDELGSFVDVTLGPRVAVPGLDLPPWIGKASTTTGRTIAWIDVEAMLVALGTGVAAVSAEPASQPMLEPPARAVIIATRNLEGALSEAREACQRAGALAIPWDGQAPLPELPQGVAAEPMAVLGALASGERQIPEELLRLCTRDRPGASLLLLCRESLVRPTVSLQNGRVNLIEPPFSVRRIASRLRLMLAPPGAERGEEERTSLIGEAASALVTVHQHQQAAYWVGALAREGPLDGSALHPPALLEEGRGLTVLVPAPGGALAAAEVGERCTQAADIVLSGGDPEHLGARLGEAMGDSAGLLFLSARGDEWLVYWPAIAWRLWLFSTQRLPSWWDLGSTAAENGARCLRLPASSGDVVMILPASAAGWAQQAARPGQTGQVPADLVEAAIDGGPALLETIAIRWRGQRESACALILEVR